MLRFQTAIAGLLAVLLVVPALVGQGQIATLQDALAGPQRALEVLRGLERRLQEEPAAAVGLVLSATETPAGDDAQRDQRLESLRSEVNLLQMELDAMQSPVLSADGAVQSALGARVALDDAASLEHLGAPEVGITTGLDDSLRALLSEAPLARAARRSEPGASRADTLEPDATREPGSENAYSADPLRHGITCYRAGRFAEAYELLAPLADATALYWQARALERLERLDDAVEVMERAIKGAIDGYAAKGSQGFDRRRAETDLEFLRWKRDFLRNLPASGKAASGKGEPR